MFVSFHILSILTFKSPILNARRGGVLIDVSGEFQRRLQIIDDSPPTIADQLKLYSFGTDEVVRLVKRWAPKAAIRVLSVVGEHLFEQRRRGASEKG